MNLLSKAELKTVAEKQPGLAISIFMPTHRSSTETRQDALRFKNLLSEAEERLIADGLRRPTAKAMLEPARQLGEDTLFWRNQGDGLAVFLAADDFHTYHLPFGVEELLIIARSYYVKPVLPLFTNNGHYYILAISQNEIRLFEGTRHSVGQIDLPEDTPASLNDALKLDDPEKQLQFRSAGGSKAMFHGQGPGDEEQKVRIERYLNLVDAGLKEIFREQQAPLVLAGVDYLLPIYRQVSEYANIMPEGITGSPEQLRPEELQEKAWPIVEPYFRREMEEVIEQYQQLAGAGKAAANLEEIVAAAYYGRVDRLVLAVDTQVWGSFNPDTGKVGPYQERQSQADDLALLDFAAMQTLQNGGTVYALLQKEMPADSPMLAVFRY